MKFLTWPLLCLAVWISSLAPAYSRERPLLDVVDIQGIRDNQLVGYGLTSSGLVGHRR